MANHVARPYHAAKRAVAAIRVRLQAYSPVQLAYAQQTVDQVVALQLGQRAAVIAVETMMTESNITMQANGYNAESLTYPHDAVGWDHGSVNQYQQQVGGAPYSTANWGTTAELMQTHNAISLFLQGLQGFDWQSMTNWDAAQKVQGSFDPTGGNYKRNDARAQTLVAQLWPVPVSIVKDDDMFEIIYVPGSPGQPNYAWNANGLFYQVPNASVAGVQASKLCTGRRPVEQADFNVIKQLAASAAAS